MGRDFDQKTVLVTGGSRGIGRAIACAFAAEGARVLINFSTNSEAAIETIKLCEQVGGSAELLPFNTADSLAVDKAFDQIKATAGGLDVLVNNAGITRDGLIIRMKDEDWAKVIDINLNGSFYCARAAVKLMMKARKGRIVNISSVVGEMGNAGQTNYVASKAGLIGFTKALAREVASRGITVNAVAPGFINTDMTAQLSDQIKEQHLQTIPLGRFGEGSDIAEAVCFLASDRASYLTGQVLGVNGGMYM